ncbi:hypothetical protein CFP56_002670 [Quercus suber]|uniref:Uncharacterized protein n=1 Tax=Quercus suber TaxID=58331 RepID=A0AAW0LDY9_QUESU
MGLILVCGAQAIEQDNEPLAVSISPMNLFRVRNAGPYCLVRYLWWEKNRRMFDDQELLMENFKSEFVDELVTIDVLHQVTPGMKWVVLLSLTFRESVSCACSMEQAYR